MSVDLKKKIPAGWYDLRSSLPLWLGERLIFMAEHAKSYPSTTTPEAWGLAIRDAGRILSNHGSLDKKGNATDASFEKAKEALHWIADNLEDMWS